MKRPVVEYRTVTVKSIDPDEEPTTEQQVLVTWDEMNYASFDKDGDSLSIVYTADTRKEFLQFLARLSKALAP